MGTTPKAFSTIDEARTTLQYNCAQSLYMSKIYIFPPKVSKPSMNRRKRMLSFKSSLRLVYTVRWINLGIRQILLHVVLRSLR